ncbi:MAG: AAA domain-containing protein [Aristaeellaceae bacterium]
MPQENMHELAHALFAYMKEVHLLNQQKILDVDKQLGAVLMRSLDDPACVTRFSRDTVDGAVEDESDTLLTFHKPDFTACPAPDASLERWLLPGWNDYHKPLAHIEQLMPPDGIAVHAQADAPASAAGEEPSAEEPSAEEPQTEEPPVAEPPIEEPPIEEPQTAEPQPERFTDDAQRVACYTQWAQARAAWAEHEAHTERLREAFNELFDIYNQFRQSPDTLEIMIGNGLLTDQKNRRIHHPLFLKRVFLTLDAVRNTLILSDSDEPAQMYLPMFSMMEDVNVDIITSLEQMAEDNNIHPLDHHAGADLLKAVAHQLHASSRYQDAAEDTLRVEERILVKWEPYIFLRKRPDGTIKALDAILTALSKGAEIPRTLLGILGQFTQPTMPGNDPGEPSDEDSRASSSPAAWTEPHELPLEDEDLLLPKPANREQMQIVRRIEHLPAVLVQGPPGTGKTHTIANLLGHFLAKGQTVLVTSHTSKALSVLKEKVPKGIQPLCVAMLGDDHADMEKSINAIIEHTTFHSYDAQRDAADSISRQRHETRLALQQARALVYALRNKEYEPIVYLGESWSPSKAADYVAQHEDMLALLPGPVARDAAFPLSMEELTWLYASNGLVARDEEAELSLGLPDAAALMTQQQFAHGLELLARLELQLQARNASGRVCLAWKPAQYAVVDQLTDQVMARKGDDAAEEALRTALQIYDDTISGWAVAAMAAGADNGLMHKRWEHLLYLMDEAYAKAQPVLEAQLTRPVRLAASTHEALTAPYQALLEDAQRHGRVRRSIFMSREKKNALDAVTIGGSTPESAEDMRSVLDYLELLSLREQLGQLWDTLMASHGGRSFIDLGDDPELLCHQQRGTIAFWFTWVRQARQELCTLAETAGIGDALLQPLRSVTSLTEDRAIRVLMHVKEQLMPAVNHLHLVNALYTFTCKKEKTLRQLSACGGSVLCGRLRQAMEAGDPEAYGAAVSSLAEVQQKAGLHSQRVALLAKIEAVAPAWAKAIRERSGVHDEQVPPDGLLSAWKVHQLAQRIDEIISTSLDDAENRVTELTAQFHKDTEKLASTLAWLHLQQRIDRNPGMRQSLNGWKMTMNKIGKGTGKRVPALRAEARKLMIECQKAVPAWIMPVSSVMSSIDAANTKFDVIIVDEASQSDITASAILYMGRKIIVVGDDEQVSPMAIGVDEDRMQVLMNMLIKGKIPNAHLWDARTSLYDIAAQVYQPLMLREHFRCVPDIIGYSNMLSYQGKIKPLREAGSSPFKTATVPYRVQGMRKGSSKVNEEEAKAIVALIRACIEQPAYADKTFGVISMLGDDQVRLIGRLLANEIPLAEYEKHHILCGNASNFQGDERDVIFLSLVDSNEGEGPLPMVSGEGMGPNGKAVKQRYNVAVSRARDQLWVVHSLDCGTDLKPGDMRRRLLEYVAAPHAAAMQAEAMEQAADSPFEAEVAKALAAQGYHIVQQWQVGAYRIDMVAMCGKQKIAIECDGERWHSSEKAIRHDVERQDMLERLGWRFIRIRGSEYYRDRAQTIARVVSELNALGIEPEAATAAQDDTDEDVLLTIVKLRAMQLLNADRQAEAAQALLPGEEMATDTNAIMAPIPQ